MRSNHITELSLYSIIWNKRGGLPVYTLEDWQNEKVDETFYELESQQVTVIDNCLFKVQHILKSRKRRGHEKEYHIKWKDNPPNLTVR